MSHRHDAAQARAKPPIAIEPWPLLSNAVQVSVGRRATGRHGRAERLTPSGSAPPRARSPSTIAAPRTWTGDSASPEHQPRDRRREDGLRHPHDRRLRRPQVLHRDDDDREREHRAEHDHPRGERRRGDLRPASPNRWSDPANWSNGNVHGGWTMAQNSAAAPMPHIVRLTGSRGVRALDRHVRRQVVHDEREHGPDRERDAQRVEHQALPDLRDDREPDERRDEGEPTRSASSRGFHATRNQTAISSGAVNSMSSVIPMGIRSIAAKYRNWVIAMPRTPYTMSSGSSLRRSRSAARLVSATNASRMRNATVARSCERSLASIPPRSSVLATVPLSANRSAAPRYSR